MSNNTTINIGHVENVNPNVKEVNSTVIVNQTSFVWHPATESPGKRQIVVAFKAKGHENQHYLFECMRFMAADVIPAECYFKMNDGTKKLPVAWAYHDEIIKGITQQMFRDAEAYAWGWWPDDMPIDLPENEED